MCVPLEMVKTELQQGHLSISPELSGTTAQRSDGWYVQLRSRATNSSCDKRKMIIPHTPPVTIMLFPTVESSENSGSATEIVKLTYACGTRSSLSLQELTSSPADDRIIREKKITFVFIFQK